MKSIFVFFLCLVTTGAYPVIRTPPVLTGPDSVNSTHFAFNCEVIYPFSDPSLAFEVVWLFNGLEAKDVPPQTLVDPERTASLDGESLTGHMDTNLGCQVRSYYTDDPSDKSPFEKSTTYFIGIQVNPSRLRVDVDTESMNQTVTVISTIPIICDNSPRDCCLNFEVNIERVPDISIGIPSRSSICANDWNDRFKVASMEIPISIQRDSCPRFDGDRRLRLTFNEKEPTGQGGNLEIFKGITIPEITVLLKSKKGKYTCALTGDPHIRDFQGQGTFHLFKAGDFTAYTVPARDLRIQIRTRPCFPQNGRVTCICGVIIQERNDVIRLLGCDGAPVVYTAFKLSKDVLVERSADGWSYEVYLPSGTKVQVIGSPRPYMDVYITTSNIDLGQGRGLCGVNDQLADPGFTRLDGTVDPLCSPNTAYCIPEAFLESWRLSQSDSRFLTVDYRDGDKENLTSCENRNNIRVITCLNCVDVTRSLQTFYTEGQGWNDQPDTPYIPGEVAPFDPNIDWPNENGVTESEARELCLKAIQASQLFSKCEIVNQLQQSSMEDCMADILFGGSTEFLSAITSSVTIQCQIHVEQDPSSFLNSTDGDLVIRPELRVCPIGCKKHGQCDDRGVCICNNGWEGVACQIESGKGPQMVRVRGGPICDLAFQNCSVIGFDVTNVNLLEDMYCQIQLLTEEKNNTKQTVVVEATVFSPTRISCQLPETVISNQLYRISAMTNNNTGNGLEVRVFDSRCLTCTLTRCSPKRSVCNIDNVCYQNGEINQDDSTQVCDASQNRNAWTQTVPEMTSLPVLSGPNVDDNTFNFLCQLDYTQNNSNQAFEVVWTFDGKIDDSIPQTIVKDPETEATLDGRLLKDHFNTNVGCQVRSFYQTHPDFKSQPFNSNNIYAGIQVEPSSIRVVKKTTRVLIKIKSTLPILCNQENQECCLSFGMAISETEGLSLQNTSSARICREDWNTQDFSASVQVQVKVLRSACLSPSPDLDPRLTFTDLQATSDGGYMDIFSGYSLDDIMIDINDETFSCALYTDPHIITFDGKHYVVLQSGDYIGAEVPSRNFMVQTRVREGVNCGLIFRERNDVIRIDACFGSPMVEIARDLSENTRVLRSRDGRTFGISFPSGTDIKIGLMGQSNSVLNVFIILPGIDKNLSQGLCGTNDGNPDNDRNEAERWRVSTTSSLFNVVPFLNDSSSSRNNCSRDGTLSGTGLECRGCVDITQTLTPTYSDESGWYLHNQTVDAPEENPINVDQTWPNAQGVTQEEATDMCLAALQRSQLHEYCNSTFRMDETFLEDCLIDILYTGTSNYLDAITEVYTTKCLLEVAKEPDNFAENNDGELVLKPEFLEQVCLLGCDKNGHCENGTCVCQPGWEGETCHLEAGKGPQLNRIIGGPLCNTAQSECRNVTLDVSNIDLSNSLVCRIETLDDSEDVIQTRIVRARIISPSRISCDLPETVISTRRYSISMSNDRDLFGNVLQLRVYNSQCLRCTLKKCDVKSGVCEINGICYRNGERNGNDSSQVCDASQNRREWSISLPVIETKPKLLGPKIFENSSFDFWCVMSFDHEDPNIAYEVRWTFNGQEDSRIPRQVFCYPQNMTTLDGADLTLQMNTFVGCRVRSYYLTNRDAKTEFVDSNNYYVGLQVFPREMSVVGLESKTNVRLVSTIPIICTRGDSCCLNFDLEYNETSGLSLEIPQQARLCSRDWDPQLNLASTEIPVTVKQDICSTSNKSPQVSVSFQQQSPSGRGQYIDIFSGKSAGEMKINVKDETFSCALYTDPHVLTFDGKHYVVLQSGDYIGAEVPSRIFEVQTRVREGVNCGLIFRERNDVIRIDACFGFPMVEIARNLSENTRVLRSRDGRTFGISFPSGTEIMIGLMGRSNSVLNVFIILPGFDKNLSQGLCGNNDGNPGNDKNEAGRWRVSAGASLFNEVPFVNGSDCDISRRVLSTGLLCPGCVDITQTLTPTYSDETGWYLHNQTVDVPEENPINVNQTWPNAQGVTQEEATDMCLRAIQRSQLHEYCNSTFRMDETFLEDCLIDILYTGSRNYLDAITEVYTTNCLLEIAKEPDNFAENNDGELVLKPEFLEQLCLRGCDKNGRCENGTCVCQPGWEGETCHLEAGKGPQLNRIIGGPFCDVSREECRNVSLFVSNIDLSNKLACRIRPVKGTDDVVSRVRIVRATILSPYTISCDLPKLEISSRQYNISVSNDGQLFGNALQLQVFDSTCLSCDLTGCVTKTTACYINQVCYRNGAKNKNDESKICDISQSLTQWTQTIPAMYSRPTLYGPNIEGKSKSFDFGCVMAYSRNDSNVAYEIMWMFEGQEDPDIPRQTISYPETKASLDGAKLKNHMNTNVGCRARAFYLSAPSFKSSFINSNVYYVGIQVRPKKLNVVGVYTNQTVTLVSTVPVVCTGGGKCCMSLEMKTKENTDVSIQIPSDLKMCADDWNPELGLASVQFSLEITQPSCPVSRPPQRIEVEFEPLKQSNERYLNIFSGDVIRPLQIDASDEKFYCRMVTDPHIVPFDNRNYNMLLPGIFTAVEIPKEDFQIQIQTKGGAVCAVIIKEWNNVIRIDSCSGSPTVDVAFALSQQTIVQRSRRGTEFGVYLPSGAEVKVTKGRILNLFITLPAAYKNLAKGLCGTNDQNQDNEFTGPDGAQVNNPAEFGRSWRLEKEESLFSRVPFNTRDIKYNCTTDRSVLRTGLACHRCPEISQTLIPSYSDSEGWLRYPNSGTTTFPTINTNRRWPNEQGITEARATKLCQDAIQKSQLYSYCRENGGLDFTFMDDCMTDILFSGTTDFLDDITSAYTSHCQQNLAKDPENYVKVNNEAILKPEFSDHICPIGCEEHGRCLPLGRCSCDDGWEGESCHVQSGVGPILDKLIGGETCDVTQEDCTSVQIDVSNIDLSPKMRCKIQVLDPQGKLNFDPVVIAARAVSPSRVICPLVTRRGLPLRYNFSLSNDGRLYGNGLVLIVFNSTCTTCDSTGCTQKANLCHINQQCFINGELKRDDPTKVCNVSRSTSDWTPITDDTSSSELGTSVTDIPNPTEPSQGSSVVTISRPHRDFLMKCRFDPPDGIARDIKVTWFVDGSMKVTETLPNGRTESRVNVYNLPPRGKLKCKVEHHGQIYESPGLDLC